ncbi:MAG: DUF1800 domain-containing protein [Dokdonella sp.]|uniref:DUF1800 domain-containing protein n=1 Tax=Dokdonella sp. TaxID=2291710 RepID=UPI0025BDB728|nr:DUF1800 domain-containing protein [Dokdonella sp.]MBX3701313.1 DUF1800 domain-containing protein [Dokdonella sp.]
MSANAAFIASRRRLFGALLPSSGTAAPAMRSPGRTGLRELDLPVTPQALTMPPPAVRWLTRASHGFSTPLHAQFIALGADDESRWAAWLAQQLDPASIADGDCDNRIASAGYQTLDMTVPQLWSRRNQIGGSNYFERMRPMAEVEAATIIRQTYSKRQLFEVMVGFWHDHFSTFGWDYDGGPIFVQYDRDVIRPNALGNFRTMLEEVAKSTMMMYYLDQYASNRDGPNENYARELLELHTLGVENYGGILAPDDPSLPIGVGGDGNPVRLKYVDNDVYEAARALTGWTIRNGHWQYPTEDDGTYTYRLPWHDPSNKYILNRYFAYNAGDNGNDGRKLFDILCGHPGTARFVAGKLCRRFVGDNPSSALVDAAANLFQSARNAPDQIKQVVALILQSSEFKTSWGTKMKRPAMSAVSALRGLLADFTPIPATSWTTTQEFVYRVQQTGHRWFYWPTPNGYPDVQTAWASSSALGMTFRMLARIPELHATNGDNATPFLADIQGHTLAALPTQAQRTADNIVGYWCDRLLGYRPEPMRTTLVNFLRQNAAATADLDLEYDPNGAHTGGWNANDLSKHYTIARLRTTVALLLCSPEFLRR